jgi:hypothetical protein
LSHPSLFESVGASEKGHAGGRREMLSLAVDTKALKRLLSGAIRRCEL